MPRSLSTRRPRPLRTVTTALCLAAATLVFAAAVPSSAAGPASKPGAHSNDVLSPPTGDQQVTRADLRNSHATRARLARVNTHLFTTRVSRDTKVRFNLFADANFTGLVKKTETGLGMRSWSGTLTGGEGYFYAARSGNVMILHVATLQHGVFEVSQVNGSSTYRVIRLDPAGPEDAPVIAPAAATRKARTSGAAGDDSGSTIDVMVTYSNQALSQEGSLSALRARIALAVAETNGGYRNSGVKPRLRLVRIQGFNYNESNDFDTDLSRLTGTSDGYLDGVHAVRTQYGADMVAMLIENGNYCGQATSILADAATAFTVVSRQCATGYYSFAHEFGHLQGARHDTYVDPTNTPYAYGHAYVNVAQRTRTIMAYNNRCAAAGVDCTRLQYWSNPNKKYLHQATGISNTKNYLVLNNTANRVANFRPSTIAPDFSSTMNRSSGARGWSALSGSWTKGTKYYTTHGVKGGWATARHTGVFRDATFTAKVRRTRGTQRNGVLYGDPSTATPSGQLTRGYGFYYTNDGSIYVSEYSPSLPQGAAVLFSAANLTAVRDKGWNTLKIAVASGSLTFQINGTQVARVTNADFPQGSMLVTSFRDAADTGTFDVDSASARTTAAAN